MKNKVMNHLKLFWILENGQKFITMKKWLKQTLQYNLGYTTKHEGK